MAFLSSTADDIFLTLHSLEDIHFEVGGIHSTSTH